MKRWRTKISTKDGPIHLDDITIERGIFQGYYFSPLIFCIATTLLSQILLRVKTGFKTKEYNINHLNYMNNIRTCAKNRDEMTRCIEIVNKFSNYIRMDFCLDKRAVLHIEKGITSNVLFTSEITNLDPANLYEYVGISESSEILHK